MPTFLSAEWVEAFNAAVAGAPVPSPAADAALAARDRTYTVSQQVHGGPHGDVATTLEVSPDGVRMRPGADDTASVTVAIGWDDAVALASGTLSASEALGTGRIRVRGDLGVLVAGQAVLTELHPYLADLTAATTY